MQFFKRTIIPIAMTAVLATLFQPLAKAQVDDQASSETVQNIFLPLINNSSDVVITNDEETQTGVIETDATGELEIETDSGTIITDSSIIDVSMDEVTVSANAAVNIFDSRVFDWRFYVNSYADLLQASIDTKPEAETHWKTYGIKEGRQAHPGFHTRQYLDLYADLRAYYGVNNYAGALEHYLIHGISENRKGYVEGGANGKYGRWTVRNSIIYISTSKRTAGAVDSIFWGGRELINAHDHGRELQVALNDATQPFQSECFNPTQAGSEADSIKSTTTSLLEAIIAGNNTLATQVLPAFWLAPGVKSDFCTLASGATNTTLRSNYRMNTEVKVGYAGLTNAIQFLTKISVPNNVNSLTIEAPTGYMAGDFTSFYTYVPSTKVLTVLPSTNLAIEQGLPLILATSDGRFAIGCWSPDLPQKGYEKLGYGAFNFSTYPTVDDANATTKWSVVYHTGPVTAGSALHFRAYIAVGSLYTVKTTLTQLYNKVK